ncbi:hypothetical protein AeMF1_013333 [Aphanomyces euteiches]|nr:hypothetical protein AeMF1_013333 [Aphanomyces euteiches]
MSAEFTQYLSEYGIRHERTVTHTPQQNGVSERMNRTLVECARAMLHLANAPLRFWSEVVRHAVYLRNRSYSASTPKSTPYERLHQSRPDLSALCIFGCESYTHVEKHDRTKFASKTLRTMYIGHEPGVKGYRLYCAKPEKIVISRNVVFNETTCFFIDEPLPSVADLDPSIDNSTSPVQVQSISDPTPDTLPPLHSSSRTKRLPSRFNDSSDLANSNGTSRGTSTTPTRDPPRMSSVTDSTSPPSATQPTESEHFNREQPSHPTPAPPKVTPTQTPAASAVPSNATAPRVPQQPEHTPVHVDNVQPECFATTASS